MRYREDVGLPASQRFRQCGLRLNPRIDASFRNVPDRPGSAVPPGGRCEQSWGALGELVFSGLKSGMGHLPTFGDLGVPIE